MSNAGDIDRSVGAANGVGPALWIGTSWKMNNALEAALAFADALIAHDGSTDARIVRFLIPPFTVVREVAARLADSDVRVGAQNMHWAEAGAWTGEISAPMLRDCGLHLVELGHSERRAHFGESDETVGRKVVAAIAHGLQPLVCIGETLSERDAGRADEVIARQVDAALSPLGTNAAGAPVLFAYEPVWAIGEGGQPADSGYANARQAVVKRVAGERLGVAPTCLYGGSVHRHNAAELIGCEHVDGLFIGRAAWQVAGYLDILARCRATLGDPPPSSSTESDP